jgi:hypothetical protein
MPVIAKMQLNGVLNFGSGSVSKLSCVCENDLMAAYAKADEDKLFTRYSPWGEMKLGHSLRSFKDGQKFYVVALKSKSRPKCEKAAHVHPARVHVVEDYGSSKQVQLSYDGYNKNAYTSVDYEHPGELHWRMTIDNPPAVEFFTPGENDYWVAFYPDDKFTQHEALVDAHSD